MSPIRPGRAFRVSAGASFSQIRQVLTKAAAATPARVAFEKATYRLDPGGPRALIELAGAADLTIEGGGATVVLTRPAPIVKLDRCRRVMVSGFVFRNNTCRNGRRVGVLAKGDGGLIEGNLFENLGGGGVEFWNAPFEGLAAENYVVRNNRIVNCLRLSRKHAGIWCTAFRPGGSRIHRNLLIEGNEIVGAAGPAVDVGDAENVVFRGNRIVRPRPADAPGDPPIRFRNVGRLVRESNQAVTKGAVSSGANRPG